MRSFAIGFAALVGCTPPASSPPAPMPSDHEVRDAPPPEPIAPAPAATSAQVTPSAAPSAAPVAKKKERPSMTTTVADYKGGNAPGKVAEDFHEEAGDDLYACFEAMQDRNPGVLGRVLVRAFIDKDGATKAVALVEDSIGDATFAACVVEATEGITLPASDRGTAVFEVASEWMTGGIIGGVKGPPG